MSIQAFDLLSVSKYANISKIECIEASGNDVYIGSDDGLLLRIIVEERKNNDSFVYSSSIACQRDLGTKLPVVIIKAASALGRLLTLSDSNLFLLDTESLASVSQSPKAKNVVIFCVNENPDNADPFALELCIAKKKCLQLCTLRDERIVVKKEINLSESPVNIAMDGNIVCVAGIHQYRVYDVHTGSTQDLFPVDSSIVYPIVSRISKEEFLVSGPGSLGIFVTSAGTSERPPLCWTDEVLSVCYYHPYILTLTSSFIRVFSLMDEQLKQTIIFNGGTKLGNFDGQLYVSSSTSLHCLMPRPWTTQVMTLLENESAEEAIELTEHSGGAGMTSEQYLKFTFDVLQRAGFVKFAQEAFEEAQDFFLRGRLDVRELLAIFPGLLASASTFTKSQPPLHSLADVSQAFKGQKDRIESAKQFLLGFLLQIRNADDFSPYKMEIDTALLKLYSSRDVDELIAFTAQKTNSCSLSECVQVLEKKDQFVALAKLYSSFGETEKSLDVLTKLVRCEITDNKFNGPQEIVDSILSLEDEALVWRFSDFILDADESEGLRLLCCFSGALDTTRVLKSLAPYPKSRIEFLHQLIGKNPQVEPKFHTELVLHYVEEAVEIETHGLDSVDGCRKKLQNLLITSDRFNPEVVLARLINTKLSFEKALVYGKLNEHEKALSILVHEVRDFKAAEEYCDRHSRNYTNGSSIYVILLKAFLSPIPGSGAEQIELSAALQLLSHHSSELRLPDVLRLLPSEWSVSITHHYLKGALRTSLHQYRMTKMKRALAKCQNIQQKFVFQSHCKTVGPIVMTSSSVCCVCQKGFQNSSFSLYPNGVLTHVKCAKNRHVCPLTGKAFSTLA